MRLLLAANNQATRRNEIIKSYLQLGSSSNRYAPRLPQQETKSSTKQLPPTDPILGPESLLKTGFSQKGLPSSAVLLHSLDGMAMWFVFLCSLFLFLPHQYLSWYNAIISPSSIVTELDRRSLSTLLFWCVFLVGSVCVFCCFWCGLVVCCFAGWIWSLKVL